MGGSVKPSSDREYLNETLTKLVQAGFIGVHQSTFLDYVSGWPVPSVISGIKRSTLSSTTIYSLLGFYFPPTLTMPEHWTT
jgi:hypothetical protein